MPVDKTGLRADIVMDAGSTINRMNLGRLYEQYFGSAANNLTLNICSMLGIQHKTDRGDAFRHISNLNVELQNQVYELVLGFYNLISEQQYLFYRDAISLEERIEHLVDIVNDGIYLFYPTNNPKMMDQVVIDIEESIYAPPYGPVSYVGNSGKRVTTDQSFRIGPLYMMLLEKITDDWSSVSSGKLQHFGILSPTTKSEKYAHPFRNSPVRAIGETEGRIFAGYCGREAIAEMMDRNNNPITHRKIVKELLSSEHPTNINNIVNREDIPLGSSKPLQLVNHIAITSGWQPVYEPPDSDKGNRN